MRHVVYSLERANCGRRSGRAVAAALLAAPAVTLVAGCGGTPVTYPDLRTFPARAEFPATLEERREIGNELLADRTLERFEADRLRERVGLLEAAPDEPAPAPILEPVPLPPPEPPRPPSTSPEARFLRQQIFSELEADDIDDFLLQIEPTPVDIDPATGALSQLEEERRLNSVRFFGSYSPPSLPGYPDWGADRPLLDRLLRGVGRAPGGG